jgi:hypothetical protein
MNEDGEMTIAKSNILALTITIGLVTWFTSPSAALAEPKQTGIYNRCACLCGGPGEGPIIDITNSGGFSCDAYNGATCNYEDPATGGIRTSTARYCVPDKSGGTRAALMLPRKGSFGSVMARGVESGDPISGGEKASAEPAAEAHPPAVIISKPGNVMMNCSCDGGEGNCSVTSTDGKTSTCHKGEGDTCTGTCSYPKGTISGFSGAAMSR